MCFVWISEQTAIISLYSINRPVLITKAISVYCAVRTRCSKYFVVTTKQASQCTCKRKHRCFRVTVFAVEERYVLHFLAVCLFPFLSMMHCASTVTYFHLRPDRLYHIFPHYLTNGAYFHTENFDCTKLVFRLSLQLLPVTFLVLRII